MVVQHGIRRSGACLLLVGDKILTQDRHQQGLLQIQALLAHQRVRPVILLGHGVGMAHRQKYQAANIINAGHQIQRLENGI